MIKTLTIGIDAGHGGVDRSNRGQTGYVEADGNLKMAKYLAEELQARAVKSVLTRDKDMTVELRNRANILAANNVDLAISIHSNAGNKQVRGVECYYSVDIKLDNSFAASMTDSIAKKFGVPDRGAKCRAAGVGAGQSGATATDAEDYYAFIDQAQDKGIPHVLLIEVMYHDNLLDEAILKNDKNLKEIAQLLADDICTYFKVEVKSGVAKDLEIINKALYSHGLPELTDSYWVVNAVKGKTCDGAYVVAAFNRIAKLL